MAHTYVLSTQEAEAGGSSGRPSRAVWKEPASVTQHWPDCAAEDGSEGVATFPAQVYIWLVGQVSAQVLTASLCGTNIKPSVHELSPKPSFHIRIDMTWV